MDALIVIVYAFDQEVIGTGSGAVPGIGRSVREVSCRHLRNARKGNGERVGVQVRDGQVIQLDSGDRVADLTTFRIEQGGGTAVHFNGNGGAPHRQGDVHRRNGGSIDLGVLYLRRGKRRSGHLDLVVPRRKRLDPVGALLAGGPPANLIGLIRGSDHYGIWNSGAGRINYTAGNGAVCLLS